MLISWFLHSLLILLSVAFFTLFERNVIGLFHGRLGPNNVSLAGLIQPLLDAFKLLIKQDIVPLRANNFTYRASPHLALLTSYFIWLTLPSLYLFTAVNYSFIMFFCVGSAIVFSVLLAGWSSNSKYSLIGGLRSIAQSISYESVYSTLIVLFMFTSFTFSIRSFLSTSCALYLMFLPLWFICTLAETHRAPFDFSEAESELVSGFNTEYSGAYFAFIFLSEYGVLLFCCFLITFIFFSFILPSSVFLYVFVTLLISYVFIWVRITFCRFRYDLLMMASWKVFLPVTLISFLLLISVLFF